MVQNPALMLRRNVSQSLPLPIMYEVVRHTTDFELAVAFFKMGYPLKLCMQGVPWPQVWTRHYEISIVRWDEREWQRRLLRGKLTN